MGKPRVVHEYSYQDNPGNLVVWVGTDCAGCKETRKSTSGGMLIFGTHCWKSWSATQAIISLSSGEAELAAERSQIYREKISAKVSPNIGKMLKFLQNLHKKPHLIRNERKKAIL